MTEGDLSQNYVRGRRGSRTKVNTSNGGGGSDVALSVLQKDLYFIASSGEAPIY